MSDTTGNADICVMGGGGHVGLPLSIVFASRGKKVRIFDINRKTIETVMSGQMPFMEYGAEPVLKEVLAQGMLDAASGSLQDISEFLSKPFLRIALRAKPGMT